jgi:hypothetical protein
MGQQDVNSILLQGKSHIGNLACSIQAQQLSVVLLQGIDVSYSPASELMPAPVATEAPEELRREKTDGH